MPTDSLAFVRAGPGQVQYPGDVIMPENPEIYLLDAGTSQLRNLTQSESLDLDPRWAPRGEQIVYLRAREPTGHPPRYSLYIIDASQRGSSKPLLPCGPDCRGLGSAAWSPDGSRIAFVDFPGISVVDADGSNRRQLLGESKQWTGLEDLEWSRDGRFLAFNARGLRNGKTQLLLLDIASKKLSSLGNPGYRSPSWSPDNTRIAAVVGRDGRAIHLLDAGDGSVLREVVTCSEPCYQPQWSTGGDWIAFTQQDDIYVVMSEGGSPIQLTSGPHIDCCATWKPSAT